MAGVDILASAFTGANAAFLGEQYARWAIDPASVDPSFADLFDAMNDEARAVLEDATGASWAPPPRVRTARPTAAGIATARNGGLAAGASPRRHHRLAARADADPLLSRARPSGGAARPARPANPGAARRARPAHLRLHRRRPRPADLHRQRAGPRNRDAARDHHASCARPIAARSASSSCTSRTPTRSPGSSAGSRARPGSTAFDADGKAHHPAATDRSRRLRGVLPEALRHHEALRAGGRRGHHPRDARDHRDRRRGRRARDRHRHAASRPAQHAGQHRQEAADRAVQRIRRRELQARRRAGLGRREIPPRHLDRSGDRRPQRASVAAAQPVASGGGRSGGGRQGARAPGPGRRHASAAAR